MDPVVRGVRNLCGVFFCNSLRGRAMLLRRLCGAGLAGCASGCDCGEHSAAGIQCADGDFTVPRGSGVCAAGGLFPVRVLRRVCGSGVSLLRVPVEPRRMSQGASSASFPKSPSLHLSPEFPPVRAEPGLPPVMAGGVGGAGFAVISAVIRGVLLCRGSEKRGRRPGIG